MKFTWDKNKNRINKLKHGISFETAVEVFFDLSNLTIQDREVYAEERWQTIGMVDGCRIVLVAHTIKEISGEEEEIRIISARKATAFERKLYEKGSF